MWRRHKALTQNDRNLVVTVNPATFISVISDYILSYFAVSFNRAPWSPWSCRSTSSPRWSRPMSYGLFSHMHPILPTGMLPLNTYSHESGHIAVANNQKTWRLREAILLHCCYSLLLFENGVFIFFTNKMICQNALFGVLFFLFFFISWFSRCCLVFCRQTTSKVHDQSRIVNLKSKSCIVSLKLISI